MKFGNTDNHGIADRDCNKLRANDEFHKIESRKICIIPKQSRFDDFLVI